MARGERPRAGQPDAARPLTHHPLGSSFQFRNTGGGPLTFVIATTHAMPRRDRSRRIRGSMGRNCLTSRQFNLL
jgi:hypothetical protein